MEKFLLKYFTLIRVIIAIGIGIVISVFLIYLTSQEPGFSLRSFLLGPFLTRSRLAHLFETASPIIFCGLAIAVAFQAKQFNIGAEGSLYLGAAVGTAFAVSTNMPAFIHIPLVLLIAGLTGALWSFIPGILKAKWKASELVSSLMLNYVAYFLGLYLINYHFRDKEAGFLVSFKLPETAWLARFIPDTRIHYGIILALVLAVLVYYFLYHTTAGYEIRSTGFNERFARFGGISVFKVIILCQVILGFLAAFGGMTEVMGIHRRFLWQSSPGYGWDGIIVAIIGRSHPLLIVPASFFLAYMRVGGRVLNLMSDVPAEMVMVIQSIIILLITAEAFLSQWKYRITVRQAERGGAA
ncbi:MAG: ABC transporter permease [Spirochaetales bacterium]|nr:ABC transporter permease [Spirochaetales bacterium]